MRQLFISILLLQLGIVYGQNVVYTYNGDFNEESTSFGLRITHSTSELGHTHHGDYLINLSSRQGSELYHLRINSEYNIPYSFHLERLSGQVWSNDNVVVSNTKTNFNLEIRFHGPQNDWHKITVHELVSPRGSAPTFAKIDPSQFQSGTKISSHFEGIGLSSPQAMLHVKSDMIDESSTSNSDANLLIEAKGTRDVNKGAVLGFELPANTDGSNPWQHGRIMVLPDNPNSGRADGKMLLQARYYTGTSWDWQNNLALASNGNVGIGTISPNEKLWIENGNIAIDNVDGKGLILYQQDARRFGKVLLEKGSGTGSGTKNTLLIEAGNTYGPQYGQRVLFRTGASDRMVIEHDGNVGIGTTNPDEKLTVKGTVHAQEVKVDLSVPGPDYVFEPTYDLRSLEETAAYIKSNKHLPEVPSAKEMEANGVQLGEMNMLLLKKIEELTLYVIELKDEIEKLKQENDDSSN